MFKKLTSLFARRQKPNLKIMSPIPNSFDIELTVRCNSKCLYCSYWKEHTKDLELIYVKKYLKGISRWRTKDTLVTLIGGEPTIRPDLREIVKYCLELKIKPSITTNGYRFSDFKYAKSIVSLGIERLVISLDGFKETNNFTRAKVGFERVVAAIKNVRKLNKNVKIHILTVITNKNIDELPKFVLWLKENNFADYVSFQFLVQDFRQEKKEAWWEDNILWPKDLKLLNKRLDELIFLRERDNLITNPANQLNFWRKYYENPNAMKLSKQCNVGDFYVNCSNSGDIHICSFMPSVGNIKNNTLQEIFYSALASQRRKEIAVCKKVCHFQLNCRYEELMA